MAMLAVEEISIVEFLVGVVLLSQPSKVVTFPDPFGIAPDVIDEPAGRPGMCPGVPIRTAQQSS